ncbi:DUF600 family protein [Arthrobacter sp. zg-Y826]|uniref:immunity protein YezG family protein n=1 Tax=Arthrobacter jinronghuae TaxID=2964609 RepID=UPI002103420F|nr:immunity protein YezG family protein [Arthrobacter jinronghuae]MCQ1957901.1 DUF600 family protein [Arthrobacter jinronghuae]
MSEESVTVDVVLRRTELERDLARVLDASVPEGWQSLRYEAASAGRVTEGLLHVERNGVVQPVDSSDEDFALLRQLRKLMYRPAYGTWFSLEMHIDNQGHVETHYNYDEEADWSFPLADRSYQQDQQKFPRDPEHIPAWLAPKLGLGGHGS